MTRAIAGILLCLPLFATASFSATTIHIAPGGDDAATGAADAPLRTFTGARDHVRALRAAGNLPAGGVTIEVASGEYALNAPLALTQEDSGTAASPIVWRAAKPGEVLIAGSRVVPSLSPVSDAAILDRLPEEARGQIYSADLKALGITDYGSPEAGGLSLLYNGDPMTLARWPNDDFTRIMELKGGEEVTIHGIKGDKIGKWVYDGDRPARWVNEPDAWVHGYWFWDWSDQRHKVKAIDTTAHTIEVEEPYHGYGYRKDQWYYAFNLLSEIDRPGEWYLDRGTGVLYVWPPSDPKTADIRVTLLNDLITMQDVSHVSFEGFRLEGSRKQAVGVSGGESVRLANCTLVNIAGDAVIVRGGKNHTVEGCEFTKLGGGAISMDGGDRPTLTPAGHVARNNHIHDYGQWFRMYHAGISISGVGITVAHNHIHNAPHMAIYFNGNDFLIEYNEIHDVCLESNDAGAIYAGRDWTMRGTEVRYNYLYNITGFRDAGCVGVYLDDMFGGTRIYGNLFYRVTRAAFIGGGRDVMVDNNVFVDCRSAFYADNRAQNWAADTVPTTMVERLNAMPYMNDLWTKRYPELLRILSDEPAAPKGNVISRNVSVGGRWNEYSDETAVYLKFEDNLVLDDDAIPAIADKKHPKATELVKSLDGRELPTGFKTLPIDKMGIEK